MALFPMNVWLSHIAKPDSGVATAILLVAWSLLRRLDRPLARGADILVGFAFAFAVSFKQTAIFVVAPLFVGFVALLRLDCGLPWPRIARASGHPGGIYLRVGPDEHRGPARYQGVS